MSTTICTNKPLNEVAVDVWQQMDTWERIKFLSEICAPKASIGVCSGDRDNRAVVWVDPDTLFSGSIL